MAFIKILREGLAADRGVQLLEVLKSPSPFYLITYWTRQRREKMKKFYIFYICGIVISFATLIGLRLTGMICWLCWSIWCNAVELLIIIVMARGVSAKEIICSPGFAKRYHKVFLENLEFARENARCEAELEWIKKKPVTTNTTTVQQPHPGTKKFISLNGMSTKEKRIRAYLMSSQGISDNEIADKIGLKVSSIPGYRSDGKKIVEKYKQLIAGHSIDEVVDFFCGEDYSHD